MKRKIPLSAALVLVLLGALITFLITNSFISRQYQTKLDEIGADQVDYQKLSTIDSIVREHYAAETDTTLLTERSIAGYIAGLNDPYSRYMTAEEYATYTLSKNKEVLFETGMHIAFGETVYIHYVDTNSPAGLAGIRRGDILLGINEINADAANKEAIQQMLYGEEGAALTVRILRGADESQFVLHYETVTHDGVAGEISVGQTGLINIFSFESNTKDLLKTTIDTLVEKGADSLVFDVRGVYSLNFDAAVSCVDVLAGAQDLAKRITAGGTTEVISGEGSAIPLPCAVLIDKNTSGAPELFAASLYDTVGALLVGETTKGCASVQADIRLSDLSAIILTTKIYCPPQSPSFENIGVLPTNEVTSGTDFRTLSPGNETVFMEAYYLLKPNKRPSKAEENMAPNVETPDASIPQTEIDTGAVQEVNTTP